jgi:hypothetical protein
MNFIDFFKNQIVSFVNFCPMGAELLHADKHDEDNNRFSKFLENAWKIVGDLVIVK